MSTFSSTYAVVEDQYRRERAAHDVHAVGGGRHHGRFATWRDRRRSGRSAAK